MWFVFINYKQQIHRVFKFFIWKTFLSAKTASKRVVQKTAVATGDLIGNKIADKITSLGKIKSKEKEDERQEIYIPPEKRQ